MHLLKDANWMYVMDHGFLLRASNLSMLLTLLAFAICTTLAYGFESKFPLFIIAMLHIAQIVLAGLFKVSYVTRLVSLKQLGRQVN